MLDAITDLLSSSSGQQGGWRSGRGLAMIFASFLVVLSGSSLVNKDPLCRAWQRCRGVTLFVVATSVILGRVAAGIEGESLMEKILRHLRDLHCNPLVLMMAEDLLAVVLAYAIISNILAVREILRRPWSEHKDHLADSVFRIARYLPPVARRLKHEVEKTEAHLRATLRPKDADDTNAELPDVGLTSEEVLRQMESLADKERSKWNSGKASGAVYNDAAEHASFMSKAYALFSHSNPLHPDLWPSGLKFEAEVISMTARLLDGGDRGVCGILTSGGTESIILAAKAHRGFYKLRGIAAPEIVAATSAHAAIEKACDLLNIRLIKVPVNPRTLAADVEAMAKAVTCNTIMLYASAPSFPHGVIDPIKEMSTLARRRGCGLHVDCCLGGFVLPFARRAGYPVQEFDFGLSGVTSMSADTHKYGYASKGTSVALFRNKELRHAAYFCFPDWTGGLYVTPTIAGSRPGGLTAACWASMMKTGKDGYERAVKSILETSREIADGILEISGLTLMGDPRATVVCFRGRHGINTYKVGDNMSRRGWNLNALQRPPSLHICVTLCHVGQAQVFLRDLEASTSEAEDESDESEENSTAAIYGMAASMPAGPVNVLLKAYTDITLDV